VKQRMTFSAFAHSMEIGLPRLSVSLVTVASIFASITLATFQAT
jgi:hypothetical protein